MSAAANSFLRLNSTTSQPNSPSSHKNAAKDKTPQAQQQEQQQQQQQQKCWGPCYQFFRTNPRLRKGLSHLSLVILLGFYTAAGASVRTIRPSPRLQIGLSLDCYAPFRIVQVVLDKKKKITQVTVHTYDSHMSALSAIYYNNNNKTSGGVLLIVIQMNILMFANKICRSPILTA